jgi:hypothetical protein
MIIRQLLKAACLSLIAILPIAAEQNLALNRPATARSTEGVYAASKAVDGNSSSRWGSNHADSQWIYIDLGYSYAVNRVVLRWEAAYGRVFTIDVSADADSWQEINRVTNGTGGVQQLSFSPAIGRYVRMNGITRGTTYGFSLWELEVYGQGVEDYTSWTYSRRLYLNTSSTGANVAGEVRNFPALIRLTGENFDFSQALGNGADVRFESSEGNPLSYEIETWQQDSNRAAVWVMVPRIIGSTSSQYMTMHWGKASATSQSNAAGVFPSSEGYAGVWHLASGADASGNNNSGTPKSATEPMPQSGLIGKAMDFDGTDDYIQITDQTSLHVGGIFTLSGWFKYEGSGVPSDWQRIISKKTLWNDDGGFEMTLQKDDDDAVELLARGVTSYKPENVVDAWSAHDWEFLCTVFNGTSVTVYINGALKGTGTVTAISDNTNPIVLGTNVTHAASHFNGDIDELRLSSSVRNNDWIKLSYENQRPNQKLVEFGPFGNEVIAPSQFIATATGTTINLSWHDNAVNEDGFEISLGVDAEDLAPLISLPSNSQSYSHEVGLCGISHVYAVKAFKSDGHESPTVITSSPVFTQPCQPVNLRVTAKNASEVTLAWEGTAPEFVLEGKTSDATGWNTIYNGSAVSFVHQGLMCHSEMEYRVNARNPSGESNWTATVAATTDFCTINTPTSLRADNSIPQKITLTWVDNANNEIGYKVFRRAGTTGDFQEIESYLPPNTITYIDLNAMCNTNYQYYVMAFDAFTVSGASNTVTTTTLFCGAGESTSRLLTLRAQYLESDDTPFSGQCNLVVKLYASNSNDGTPVFEESFSGIQVNSGYIAVAIGQRQDVAAVLWEYTSLYFDMIIDGVSIFNNVLKPITASPYSLKTATNLHGEGSPIAVVIAPVGATYVDIRNHKLYIKIGETANDWVLAGN